MKGVTFIGFFDESAVVSIHAGYVSCAVQTTVIADGFSDPCVHRLAVAHVYNGGGVLTASAGGKCLDSFVEARLVCVGQGENCATRGEELSCCKRNTPCGACYCYL